MWKPADQLCFHVYKCQLQPHTVQVLHTGVRIFMLCIHCMHLHVLLDLQSEGTTFWVEKFCYLCETIFPVFRLRKCVFMASVQGSTCDMEVVQFKTVRYLSSERVILSSSKSSSFREKFLGCQMQWSLDRTKRIPLPVEAQR